MKIIAAKDFTLKGILYNKDEEIRPPKDYLVKLNEEGYIEPIDIDDIDNYDETKAVDVKENIDIVIETTQKTKEESLEIVEDEVTETLTEEIPKETVLEEEIEEKEVEVKEKKSKIKKEVKE